MEKPFVLLVEDNEATRTLIAALLRRDFVCEVAHDGAEAIEQLRLRRYAVVLLDLLMPVVDGFGVLDYLAEEQPEMLPRVVVVTAALSERELERLRRYGIADVIRKPFEVDVLLATVRHHAGLDDDDGDAPFLRGPLLTGGVLLLIADLLRRV